MSSGKPQATVPDLTNLTQADATNALTSAGLKLGTVTAEPSATVPAGSVISQDPAAGTKVDKGSSVSIVVSTGSPSPRPTPIAPEQPREVAVPNVYGMQSTCGGAAAPRPASRWPTARSPTPASSRARWSRSSRITGTVVPEGSTVLLVIAS